MQQKKDRLNLKCSTAAEAALQAAKESLSKSCEECRRKFGTSCAASCSSKEAYQAALTAQADQEAKVAVLTAVQAQAKATYMTCSAQTYAEAKQGRRYSLLPQSVLGSLRVSACSISAS